MAKQAIGMKLQDFQKNYFTRPHVRRRLDKLRFNYLRYQGMNIRRDARRKVMSQSEPPIPDGETKSGGGLALIFYSFERQTHSVIVGPTLFEKQPWKEKTVPQVVEEGGYVTPKPGFDLLPRRQEPSPYMRPAFEKNLTQPKQKRVWSAAKRKAGV